MKGLVAVIAMMCAGGPVACGSRPAESARPQSTAQTRTYFVAADDVVWDYAPGGTNRISGKPFEGFELFITTATPITLGRVYKKTVFREYTDGTFTTSSRRRRNGSISAFSGR